MQRRWLAVLGLIIISFLAAMRPWVGMHSIDPSPLGLPWHFWYYMIVGFLGAPLVYVLFRLVWPPTDPPRTTHVAGDKGLES